MGRSARTKMHAKKKKHAKCQKIIFDGKSVLSKRKSFKIVRNWIFFFLLSGKVSFLVLKVFLSLDKIKKATHYLSLDQNKKLNTKNPGPLPPFFK